MQFLRPRWKTLIKITGPLLFVVLLTQVVDLQRTVQLLREADVVFILISAACIPIVMSIMSLRWWLICTQLGMSVTWNYLFQIFYVSWFFAGLPISGVTVLLKVVYLKQDGQPADRTVVSLTLDKLCDIAGHVAFGLLGLIYFPYLFLSVRPSLSPLSGIFIGVAVVLLTVITFRKGIRKVIKHHLMLRFNTIAHNLDQGLKKFWAGLTWASLFNIIVVIVLSELIRSLVLYILALSLNIRLPLGLVLACRGIIGVVNILPITVGGLGTRDAVLLMVLPLVGVSKESVIALSFLAFLWAMFSKFTGVVFWFKRPLPSGWSH